MVVLKGKRIYLKIPTMKDVDGIVKHINDKQVSRFLETVPYPYKQKDAKIFIKERANKHLKEKKGYFFSIFLKDNDEIIGGMCLSDISKQHKNAQIGYWIGRKFWRQGYGIEALQLILRFGFKRLKLNKIYVRVHHPNKASAGLLKKAGFREEGLFKKHVRKGKTWFDEIRFGMLREEYERKK